MTTMWLSTIEIDDICDGLKRNHERLIFLKSLGLAVKEKPNGSPLLLRSNVESVLGGGPPKAGRVATSSDSVPDRAALMAHLEARNGKKEKRRQPA
jgi:hypothetical protein